MPHLFDMFVFSEDHIKTMQFEILDNGLIITEIKQVLDVTVKETLIFIFEDGD